MGMKHKPVSDRPVALADAEALADFVESHDRALVEFYTDGCGICQSMEPVLGVVARSSSVAVGTLNPRDDPPLIDQFTIKSVPLFVLFIDGEPADRRAEGFIGADTLKEWAVNTEASSTHGA